MKRVLAAMLMIVILAQGCSNTGNAVKEKNMTMEEAVAHAFDKVYEVTENKELLKENGMSVYNATLEGDRWEIVVKASHTLIKTYVYQNGTVKVMPYRITK